MLDQRSQEERLQDALGRWAEDHAARYPPIDVLPYEPSARPEQRLMTFKTAPARELLRLDRNELVARLRAGYIETLGADAIAAADLLEATLGDAIRENERLGRSMAFLVGHADQLHDIGVVCGALAMTLRTSDGIMRNGTPLNKVMSREQFNGRPIVDLFKWFGNIYWVIPDSDSAQRWGIDADVARYVNTGALRSMLADLSRGVMLTMAPSGTAMRRELGEDGSLRALIIPPIGGATANLIRRFDAYVVVAVWGERLAFGPYREPSRLSADGATARDRSLAIVDDVAETLASLTSELAGVPVRYAGS